MIGREGAYLPERSNIPALNGIPLEPAGASIGPDKSLMHMIFVLHQLINNLRARDDRLDVLLRDLADPLQDVVGAPVNRLDKAAVRDDRVRAHEDEVIRHILCRDGQIAHRVDLVLSPQVDVVAPEHVPARLERDIEARRARQHVDLPGAAVSGRDGVLGDPDDALRHQLDIGLLQGF